MIKYYRYYVEQLYRHLLLFKYPSYAGVRLLTNSYIPEIECLVHKDIK